MLYSMGTTTDERRPAGKDQSIRLRDTDCVLELCRVTRLKPNALEPRLYENRQPHPRRTGKGTAQTGGLYKVLAGKHGLYRKLEGEPLMLSRAEDLAPGIRARFSSALWVVLWTAGRGTPKLAHQLSIAAVVARARGGDQAASAPPSSGDKQPCIVRLDEEGIRRLAAVRHLDALAWLLANTPPLRAYDAQARLAAQAAGAAYAKLLSDDEAFRAQEDEFAKLIGRRFPEVPLPPQRPDLAERPAQRRLGNPRKILGLSTYDYFRSPQPSKRRCKPAGPALRHSLRLLMRASLKSPDTPPGVPVLTSLADLSLTPEGAGTTTPRVAGPRALAEAAAPLAAARGKLPPPLDPHAPPDREDTLEGIGSDHTRSSYATALAYWKQWFELRFDQKLTYPVPVPTVLHFIQDHLKHPTRDGLQHGLPEAIDLRLVAGGLKARLGPLAFSSVRNRLSVLSRAHRELQLESPCRNSTVRMRMLELQKAYQLRGEGPRRCHPLEWPQVELLLASCSSERLIDLRDRALLHFIWSGGGLARSAVASADFALLRQVGPLHFEYDLPGKRTKTIKGEAARALQTWLEAAQISSGRLFRSVSIAGQVGKHLSGTSVCALVQKRCDMAGLQGTYSTQSLRSGFVAYATRSRSPLGAIKAYTGLGGARVLAYSAGDGDGAADLRDLLDPQSADQ